MQNRLSTAHFPQNIDMQTAFTTGHFVGSLDLGYPAADAIFDQFLMAFLAGFGMINLRDDITVIIITICIHTGNRAHGTGRSKSTGTHPVGGRNALAPFNKRQHFFA